MTGKRPELLFRLSAAAVAAIAAAVAAAVAVAAVRRTDSSGGCAPGAEPEAPRIVSFVPAATETAFALGLGPYVVGRSRFCDHPPEVAGIEAVGDLMTLSESSVERLRPTHALLYSAKSSGQTPFLRALGVEIVECGATGVESVVAVADRLGDAFPAFTNGFAAGPWRGKMEALAAAPPPGPGAPAALVVVSRPETRWSDVFAAGGDTFYEPVLRAAGYSNVLSEVHGYPVLDPARVRALAPEIVFDLRPGAEPDPEETGFWSGPLPDARVAVVRDAAAVRPGPRLVDLPALFRQAAAGPTGDFQ